MNWPALVHATSAIRTVSLPSRSHTFRGTHCIVASDCATLLANRFFNAFAFFAAKQKTELFFRTLLFFRNLTSYLYRHLKKSLTKFSFLFPLHWYITNRMSPFSALHVPLSLPCLYTYLLCTVNSGCLNLIEMLCLTMLPFWQFRLVFYRFVPSAVLQLRRPERHGRKQFSQR